MARFLVHPFLYNLETVKDTFNQRMHRLIWVFPGHTSLTVGFIVHWLISYQTISSQPGYCIYSKYLDSLILQMPITIAANHILNFFLFFRENKSTFHVNHLLENKFWYFMWIKQMIHMKWKDLFSLKNNKKKKKKKKIECHLLPLVLGETSLCNRADQDQMPQNVASHLGLHSLPLVQHFFGHKWTFSNFRTSMVRS